MKWEDNFKEELQNRAMQPSDDSWETLAKKLDAVEKRKNRTLFWSITVAASVAAIVLTANIFLNEATRIALKPNVVDTQESIDKKAPLEKLQQHEQVAENEKQVQVLETTEKDVHKTKGSGIVSGVKNDVAVGTNEKRKSINPLRSKIQNEPLEDKKITEVVTHIEDLKRNNLTVTDVDIDALLQSAQKEIVTQSKPSYAVANVDAQLLLRGVESDLEQSFRRRILETLKNGYENLKTAVADRNN